MSKFAVQVIRPSYIVSEFIVEAETGAAAADAAKRKAELGLCNWSDYPCNKEYKIEVTQLPWKVRQWITG